MKTLPLSKVCLMVLVLAIGQSVYASPSEPTEVPYYHPLPADAGHIQSWYIYNDSNTDGILNPGDTSIDAMDNWWTTVSSHTQHNYESGPYGGGFDYDPVTQDMPSGPMNFATSSLPAGHPDKNNSSYNYWLPMASNEIHFYMSYSQHDNDVSSNVSENEWSLGWVTNTINKVNGQYVYDDTFGGNVEMDIFVHNGRPAPIQVSDFGYYIPSESPMVSMSNDISHLAYSNGQWRPPEFEEMTLGDPYNSLSSFNADYMAARGLTTSDFDEIVDSMELKEVRSQSDTFIYDARSPNAIAGNPFDHTDDIVDHNGNAYRYQDAFQERSTYVTSTSDGGVISGLFGTNEYDPLLNNWGDQQVIRIDISPETLMAGAEAGNITKIIFYDFGFDDAAGQVSPREIILWAEDGELFALGAHGERIYFPENRIYIAQSEIIAEPASMALLAAGSFMMIFRRRRRAKERG